MAMFKRWIILSMGYATLLLLVFSCQTLAHSAKSPEYTIDSPSSLKPYQRSSDHPRKKKIPKRVDESKVKKFLPGCRNHLWSLQEKSGISIVHQLSRGGDGDGEKNAIIAALKFIIVERVFCKVFQALNISFPHMLGGCMGLFAFLILAQLINPGLGDNIFNSLNPGAKLLTKWLPVFFVPGLAMLPLAPSMGGGIEVVKVLGVVIIGMIYTMATTGFSVLGIRTALGLVEKVDMSPVVTKKEDKTKTPIGATTKPSKAFSDEILKYALKGAAVSAVVSLTATKAKFSLATPLNTIYLGFVTLSAFIWTSRLPKAITTKAHPIVLTTVLILSIFQLTGFVIGSSFTDVLKSYKFGSLNFMQAGAGDFLLYMLGPAVVSFSMSMYSQKKLLKDNLFVVLVAVLISSAGSLFGTAAFVRLIKLGGDGDNFLRRSVLARNVTAALAMVITEILDGNVAIGASVVVLTGIAAATYGRSILDAMGLKDPVSRGLGMGAGGQSLGAASLAGEAEAFPFAAVAFVFNAILATSLITIPAFKTALLNVMGSGAVP